MCVLNVCGTVVVSNLSQPLQWDGGENWEGKSVQVEQFSR